MQKIRGNVARCSYFWKKFKSCMKIRSIILSAALSVLCIFGVCSCGNNDTAPSADAFSEWIKAYSGDLLTSSSVIRVEFNSPVAASGLDAADYISLSPSAAGEAVWMDGGSALAFVPEAGALKEGRRYTATARLDKLYPESGVKKFSFQFTVAEKKTRLAVDRVLLDEEREWEFTPPDAADAASIRI